MNVVIRPAPRGLELTPKQVNLCKDEFDCPNLVEFANVPAYCRLKLMQLCGKTIVEGGCGVAVKVEESQPVDKILEPAMAV